MTDDEIRLKIAELKGWRDLHQYNEHPLKPGAWKALTGLEGKDNNTDGTKDVPNWPGSIASAFELAAEMPYLQLTRLFRLSPWGWQCQSADCGTWGDHVIDGENKDGTPYHCGCIYADADTAARAICLAWLKWKGVEV